MRQSYSYPYTYIQYVCLYGKPESLSFMKLCKRIKDICLTRKPNRTKPNNMNENTTEKKKQHNIYPFRYDTNQIWYWIEKCWPRRNQVLNMIAYGWTLIYCCILICMNKLTQYLCISISDADSTWTNMKINLV